MSKYTVSIPGEILDEEIAFGLTFNEIIILAAVPLVLVLPALFFHFIPLWFIFSLLFIGVISVGAIIIASPTGQSPVQWFPAHLKRRINPDKYQLKPRDNTEFGSPNVVYRDVVYTAPMLEKETEQDLTEEDIVQMISEIEYAEKLEPPNGISLEDMSSMDNHTDSNRRTDASAGNTQSNNSL